MDDVRTVVSLLLFVVYYSNHRNTKKISLSPQNPIDTYMIIKAIGWLWIGTEKDRNGSDHGRYLSQLDYY